MNGRGASPAHRSSRHCPCGNPIPQRHSKYCRDCSPRASALLKRELRRRSREIRSRAGNLPYGPDDVPYWLDWWFYRAGSVSAARNDYRAYMRGYMRRYRSRRKPGRDHRVQSRTNAAVNLEAAHPHADQGEVNYAEQAFD
jgi:hypothetical protein